MGLASRRSYRWTRGRISDYWDEVFTPDALEGNAVDGGPGTGKTVVALHRSAYLLYSDPRLSQRRGGVLFVGPHQPYLAYVSDVLPREPQHGSRPTRTSPA